MNMHVHQSTYLWYSADCPPQPGVIVLVATATDEVETAKYHEQSGFYLDSYGRIVVGVLRWTEWPTAPIVSEPS